MEGLKVVYFDMGNTLLHFHQVLRDEEKDENGLMRMYEYIKEYNEKIDYNQFKSGFFLKWMEKFPERKVLLKEFDIDTFLNSFLRQYDIEFSREQCITAISFYYHDYKKFVFMEENTAITLKYLKQKGYKIGVISNTAYYEEIMIECFKAKGIHKYIDNYSFSYGVGRCKPHDDIFLDAMDKTKISPRESMMIGDNLLCDIEPAIRLGMKTCLFDNPYKKESKGSKIGNNSSDLIEPDFVVKSIEELMNIL